MQNCKLRTVIDPFVRRYFSSFVYRLLFRRNKSSYNEHSLFTFQDFSSENPDLHPVFIDSLLTSSDPQRF